MPNFGAGYGDGAFEHVTVRAVSAVVLHPVPEPATSGLAAAAFLGGVLCFRRRIRFSRTAAA